MLPLLPICIHTVGALLKVGGYRSTGNYLSAAKEQHIDMGATWDPSLELAAKRFHRSTLRGIGPPRQGEPLNFSLLLLLSFGWLPIVTGGPCNTMAVIVLFTMLLLREIEGALAERGHVRS